VPFYTDDWLTLYGGDCREVLASLPADSVDCVVTSPPYWGLRDYGAEGQLGLERTPEEYVANMVAVFREVRRVLKPSGTCWLNLGDSYARDSGRSSTVRHVDGRAKNFDPSAAGRPQASDYGMKPKDLVGIPWRVAFALQADGWYLRSDIIWSKPNPMPESVTDRPTKSHEYLFLLTKSSRYFFDSDAVREPNKPYEFHTSRNDGETKGPPPGPLAPQTAHSRRGRAEKAALFNPAGRNIRSVWTIATRPYPGAHFAVFPPELPERCIKAGSSEKGVCPKTGVYEIPDLTDGIALEPEDIGIDPKTIRWHPTCGRPWERVVARPDEPEGLRNRGNGAKLDYHTRQTGSGQKLQDWMDANPKQTTGWRPTCDHDAAPAPAVVLDPFGGSGTVGMVANRLSRRAILIDLNPEYLKQQMKRNAQTPLGLPA
jgi:DNA modification methylase